MIKTAALSLLSAVEFTATVQVHSPVDHPSRLQPAITLHVHPAVTDDRANAIETIAVYYSPLESTKVTRLVGFGMAYHMAIVYTDRAGNSYGASSGPSDNASPQTPANALKAIVFMADQQPSSFGTLVADPSNDHVFIEGHAEDYYTKDREGRAYPHSLVTRGKDLSASWASILRTYADVDRLALTYSPTSQNSNSLAGTALRRAGLAPAFSSATVFAPGLFTQLPTG